MLLTRYDAKCSSAERAAKANRRLLTVKTCQRWRFFARKRGRVRFRCPPRPRPSVPSGHLARSVRRPARTPRPRPQTSGLRPTAPPPVQPARSVRRPGAAAPLRWPRSPRFPPAPPAPPSAPRLDAPAQPGRPDASRPARTPSRPVRAPGLAQRARMLVKNSSRLFGKQWTFCSSFAFDICFTCANVCQYLWTLPDAWRLTTLIAGGRVLVRVLMTCVFLCESAEHTGRRCDKRFLISV